MLVMVMTRCRTTPQTEAARSEADTEAFRGGGLVKMEQHKIPGHGSFAHYNTYYPLPVRILGQSVRTRPSCTPPSALTPQALLPVRNSQSI